MEQGLSGLHPRGGKCPKMDPQVFHTPLNTLMSGQGKFPSMIKGSRGLNTRGSECPGMDPQFLYAALTSLVSFKGGR
jgi:hypothetical protein